MLPRKALITAALMAALLLQMTRAKANDEFKVGNWQGGAYSDKASGRFSHCAASAEYNSNILVIFSVDRNLNWNLALAKSSWRLTRGRLYKVAFVVDNTRPIAAAAYAINPTMVTIALPDSAALFQRFRHGQILRVGTADDILKFKLTDTSAMLRKLLLCAAAYRGRSSVAGNSNPFEKPHAAAPTPPTTNEYAAEATTMLANVLSAAKIENVKFLGPTERGELKNHAVWRGRAVLGTLDIYDSIDSKDITAVAPRLIASDAKSCNGTFLSGSIPGTSETPNARAFTSCQSGTTLTTVYYLAVPRKAGGIYVFSTASIGSESAAKGVDATLRGAVFQAIGAPIPREASPAVEAK